MEDHKPLEPLPRDSLGKRIAGAFIAGIRFVGHQMTAVDRNPHEGRLLGSVIPSEYIQIPDYLPVHDDTI